MLMIDWGYPRWLPALLVCAWTASSGLAQQRTVPLQQRAQNQAPYRVAERSEPISKSLEPGFLEHKAEEHPLMPTLRWADQGLRNMEKIEDYSAVVAKRERLNGTVGDYEYMFVKVRHQPFSVYMYFLGPPKLKGQEVVYVEGQNNGNIFAHGTGLRAKFGTVSLKPTGVVAMRGQRYPITELGIKNLIRRLLEVGQQDAQYGECEVKFLKGAKIKDRQCTCIQVVHPVPRRNFLFHLARIFVDDEFNMPIRYEAYDWPKTAGDPPELIEEYTYMDLKLNNGFTDADFDIRNPNYRFPAR